MPELAIRDLVGDERERAVPLLIASFVGIYRWHAKRTLRRVVRVRAAERDGALEGVAMLERLAAQVGYVYYIAVLPARRMRGVGAALLDDALDRFRADGLHIAYAAVEEDNAPSLRLFTSRGFRRVERTETGYQDGGLGAWGLRSRMMLVHGEVLLGRYLDPRGMSSETLVVAIEPVRPPP
ncbi:MAG: GNAT family N-acetyltransferase [Thermoplasmata archaeon]